MLFRRSLARPSRRRATAAVEAAFVLPSFIFFAGAALDLGRLAKATDAVNNAARNGAQSAAANNTAYADSSVIRAAAVTEMNQLPNVTSTNPTVNTVQLTRTAICSGCPSYYVVQTTVTYDLSNTNYTVLFPVGQIQRTAEMRVMPSR
jgi:hypothetical protein